MDAVKNLEEVCRWLIVGHFDESVIHISSIKRRDHVLLFQLVLYMAHENIGQ